MLDSIVIYNITPFFISVLISFFSLKFLHKKIDQYTKEPNRPQRIHNENISRLGGFSIIATITIMSIIHYLFSEEKKDLILLYLLISIPIFIFGFWEDIRQTVSPKLRIFGSLLSAILLLSIFDLSVSNVGINLINQLFNYKYVSILFSILCVVYLVQSLNVIDGLNGLSLFTGIIIFLSVSVIALKLNDFENFYLSLFFISLMLGVLLFNFPFGKIFIGDSGAYLIGLFTALSVLTLFKNNTNLSPFIIIQMLIYPSYELIRSFFRRLIWGKSVFSPDTKHLHSMLYKLNLLKYSYKKEKINSISSFQIVNLQILNFIYLITFFTNKYLTLLGIFLFVIIYEIIYYKTKLSLIIKIAEKNHLKN